MCLGLCVSYWSTGRRPRGLCFSSFALHSTKRAINHACCPPIRWPHVTTSLLLGDPWAFLVFRIVLLEEGRRLYCILVCDCLVCFFFRLVLKHACAHMHTYTNTYTYTQRNAYANVYTDTYPYMQWNICMHTQILTLKHTCICEHTHTFTLTLTNTTTQAHTPYIFPWLNVSQALWH